MELLSNNIIYHPLQFMIISTSIRGLTYNL